MEPQRDPGWQVDAGDWLCREVLRGEDDQVGGVALGVVHVGEDVAVVFGSARSGGYEDGFAGGGVAAEVVAFGGAARQVVLEKAVGERLVGEVAGQRGDGLADLANHRAVAVPMRPGDDPVVDAGEFLRAVVEGLLADCVGSRVYSPPVQGCGAVVVPESCDVEWLGILAEIDHHPPGVLVGVECVEDPAGVDLQPLHVVGAAAAAR